MCFRMILPKVILESQDTLVSSFEGAQDGSFSFSSGGYLEGGVQVKGVLHTLFPPFRMRRV